MTRYSIIALDEAFGASDDHVKVPDIEKIFDTLDRAPWWEEVKVGDEIQMGAPYRSESPKGSASELTSMYAYTVHVNDQNTFFRDTRWQPPVKVDPPVVNEEITVEQLELLPDLSIVTDRDGVAWQIEDGEAYKAGQPESLRFGSLIARLGPITLRFKSEDNQEESHDG